MAIELVDCPWAPLPIAIDDPPEATLAGPMPIESIPVA